MCTMIQEASCLNALETLPVEVFMSFQHKKIRGVKKGRCASSTLSGKNKASAGMMSIKKVTLPILAVRDKLWLALSLVVRQ